MPCVASLLDVCVFWRILVQRQTDQELKGIAALLVYTRSPRNPESAHPSKEIGKK
jgi:hypothetical protein